MFSRRRCFGGIEILVADEKCQKVANGVEELSDLQRLADTIQQNSLSGAGTETVFQYAYTIKQPEDPNHNYLNLRNKRKKGKR